MNSISDTPGEESTFYHPRIDYLDSEAVYRPFPVRKACEKYPAKNSLLTGHQLQKKVII